MVVVDDDKPLTGSMHKTPVEKTKTYTAAQQDTLNRLSFRLKSEGRNCQYSKELPDLVKYWNENVPNLLQAPNTDDHSAHLATVKKRSWSYPAKGNLQTVKQFLWDLQGCGDPEKIQCGDKMLRDRGIPGISLDNTPSGTKTGMY